MLVLQAINFEFNIFPGQTPQSIADQLRSEIVNRLGGPAARGAVC